LRILHKKYGKISKLIAGIYLMRKLNSISQVVKEKLCISCGACVLVYKSGSISWNYDRKQGMSIPHLETEKGSTDDDRFYNVCPGRGFDLIRYSKRVCSSEAKYDLNLGFFLDIAAARAIDKVILENASSGGIITVLAQYLLLTKKVNGIITAKFTYGPNGPRSKTIIARTVEELLECQGSKYCPVSIHESLSNLKETNDTVAYIGTPCQIAAIRMLMDHNDWLRKRIKYVIGTFCGGMKDYKNLNLIIRRQGIEPSEVTKFSFRGGGQPGRMIIEDSRGRIKTRPYPDYGTDTGFKKLKRCRLCIDGTAELADIACGDAWVSRFLESGKAWSVIIARNKTGRDLLNEVVKADLVETENISIDEIKFSQRSNLSSKKYRQPARRRLYQILGYKLPVFDGGLPEEQTSLWFEIKVHLSHLFLNTLESLKLYLPFIKIARWLRGTNEFKRKK
jgi:coenzyme F420 hydrogenase subunit beta